MTDTQTPAPVVPSIHVRALLTWMAIFPLVTLAFLLIGPFTVAWNPVLRSFAFTIVLVPIAVYGVMPQLLKAYGRIVLARRARATRVTRPGSHAHTS
jgi:antibiotic biosynthesis monooxygenase (ABM) superfamily enzyme